MKKIIAKTTTALGVFAFTLYLTANKAMAVSLGGVGDGADSARGLDQPISLFGVNSTFATITNVLLYIIGAIGVIMIVIGGLRYVISGGNAEQVSAAKNTILYAIIGIIIAILAYAIIHFVTGVFLPSSSGGTNV